MAACVTVNVMPAIVIVPTRVLPVVLAATLYQTHPRPVPLAPAVMVSHAALLVAVQKQLDPVITETLAPVKPVDVNDPLVGDRLAVQPAPCVTVKVFPAIVRVPTRELPVVLAATL